MANDSLSLDAIALRKLADKRAGRGDLAGRRSGDFKVADKADADAGFIMRNIAGMRAWQLLRPAERGLYRAIAHAARVADNEVIADSLPALTASVSAAPVHSVDRVDVAFGSGRMVQDDISPRTLRSLQLPIERRAFRRGFGCGALSLRCTITPLCHT